MEEFLHVLKKSPLFYGVSDDELYTLRKCCGAEQTRYEDGNTSTGWGIRQSGAGSAEAVRW